MEAFTEFEIWVLVQGSPGYRVETVDDNLLAAARKRRDELNAWAENSKVAQGRVHVVIQVNREWIV